MGILGSNLTTVKNEVFYTDFQSSLVTFVTKEVLVSNPNVTPPGQTFEVLTSTKLEVNFTTASSINITSNFLEVLRSITNAAEPAFLTTVKNEILFTNTSKSNLTSVFNEVFYQYKGNRTSGNLTTVKNEVFYTGEFNTKLTATKLEVLRSLATAPFPGGSRRLLVLWNPEDYGD